MGQTHIGLIRPSYIINQDCPIWWQQFLSWGSLFLDLSSGQPRSGKCVIFSFFKMVNFMFYVFYYNKKSWNKIPSNRRVWRPGEAGVQKLPWCVHCFKGTQKEADAEGASAWYLPVRVKPSSVKEENRYLRLSSFHRRKGRSLSAHLDRLSSRTIVFYFSPIKYS